jgi:uncharacterized protein YecE (DUF72 family)
MGTSSFSSADWVGPFYPAGTAPADFLRVYAKTFDTVEVDSTYYAIPAARTVEGWLDKTPEGFLLSAKFPRSIVHGGEAAKPDASKVLVEDAVGLERDRFLAVMERLGPRRGPLVLQFPYFGKEAFPAVEPFLERLDRFLGTLPKGTYGVEVRNRAWIGAPLREVLARHGASFVLVDQAWMPHGDEVETTLDPVVGDLAYVRLLGDRPQIEAITTTWEREVLDRTDRLVRWARFLSRLVGRGVKTLVYVNNHYAGHAPATVRRLRELFEAERRAAKDAAREAGASPPSREPSTKSAPLG